MLRIAAPLLLAAGLALASCSTDTAPQTPAATVPPAPAPAARPTTPPAAPACPLPVYDLAQARGPRLSEERVRQMLVQNPQLPAVFRHYNEYEELRVLDTLRCAGYHLLPVLWRHEDCCTTLYYLTTPPDGRSVLDSAQVANRGGDGQLMAEAQLQRLPSGELRVVVWQENTSDGQPAMVDSTVTALAVSAQGRFSQQRLSQGGRKLRKRERIVRRDK